MTIFDLADIKAKEAFSSELHACLKAGHTHDEAIMWAEDAASDAYDHVMLHTKIDEEDNVI